MAKRTLFGLIPCIFFIAGIAFFRSESILSREQFPGFISPALAEEENDDENEGESGDDDNYSSQASSSSSTSKSQGTKTILVPQAPITVTKWVSVTKQVPADGYGQDTDNDGLVDALDPHPTVPEQQFSTDSDGDGVPDSDDRFPGHNDFYTFPDTADTNLNGVLDSYESSSAQ